jgi:hypothetical protein
MSLPDDVLRERLRDYAAPLRPSAPIAGGSSKSVAERRWTAKAEKLIGRS